MSEHGQHLCTILEVPPEKRAGADAYAVQVNPKNHRPIMYRAGESRAAVIITKAWSSQEGCHLTVGFLESIPAYLKDRVIARMNDWSRCGNVSFRWSQDNPDVRVTFARGANYASLGTDLKFADPRSANMSLVNDASLDYYIWHETGHLLGLDHEHQRAEIVAGIDSAKAVEFMWRVYRMPENLTRGNVLSSRPSNDLYGTPVDRSSVMAYSLPAEIMKPGYPAVPGGKTISALDCAFVGHIYPKSTPPTPTLTPIKTKAQWDALAGKAFCFFHEHNGEVSADVFLEPEANATVTAKLAIVTIDPDGSQHYFAESEPVTARSGDAKEQKTKAIIQPAGRHNAYLVNPSTGEAFDGQAF